MALAALGVAWTVVMVQLARHAGTAVLFAAFPGPEALACTVRCLGIGPFLQVLAEAGRAAALLVLSLSFVCAVFRTSSRIVKTWAFVDRAVRNVLPRPAVPAGAAVPEGIAVVRERRPAAFTAGFLKPRIFVTTGLVEALGANELRAVLLHEERHRRSRDPLKGLAAAFVADFLFFLPVSRVLKAAHGLATETAADDQAIAGRADPLDLASSLVKVRRLDRAAASWFSDPAGIRIRRLLGERKDVRAPLGRVLLSTAVLAVVVWLALVPVKKSLVDMFVNHDRVCVLRSGPK